MNPLSWIIKAPLIAFAWVYEVLCTHASTRVHAQEDTKLLSDKLSSPPEALIKVHSSHPNSLSSILLFVGSASFLTPRLKRTNSLPFTWQNRPRRTHFHQAAQQMALCHSNFDNSIMCTKWNRAQGPATSSQRELWIPLVCSNNAPVWWKEPNVLPGVGVSCQEIRNIRNLECGIDPQMW